MTTGTYRLSKSDFDRKWHVMDAAGQPLGRLASTVASLLLGKHKPTYEPHLPMGDYVVVVNASAVYLSGKKPQQKVYYRHSGYPGGLRERTFEQQMARDPRRVIERAVRGMLPHNSLGRELFRHLHVYAGPEHPHEAQVMAGTGARARKRAAREQAEARAPVAAAVAVAEAPEPTPAEAVDRPRSLSRWLRADLDEQATRMEIEIDPAWKKADVVAAIEQARAAAESGEDA